MRQAATSFMRPDPWPVAAGVLWPWRATSQWVLYQAAAGSRSLTVPSFTDGGFDKNGYWVSDKSVRRNNFASLNIGSMFLNDSCPHAVNVI
jgi:hypothetical protein